MQAIDFKSLIQLKAVRHKLTVQQDATIKGQILAGDPDRGHERASETITKGVIRWQKDECSRKP